jgi:hypothetical protein
MVSPRLDLMQLLRCRITLAATILNGQGAAKGIRERGLGFACPQAHALLGGDKVLCPCWNGGGIIGPESLLNNTSQNAWIVTRDPQAHSEESLVLGRMTPVQALELRVLTGQTRPVTALYVLSTSSNGTGTGPVYP